MAQGDHPEAHRQRLMGVRGYPEMKSFLIPRNYAL
jgi:hypothetical protein